MKTNSSPSHPIKSRFLTAIVLCLLTPNLSSLTAQELTSELRTWSDSTGKFEVKAELLWFKDGVAALQKTDGRVVELDLEQLSSKDQKFIEQLRQDQDARNPFAGGTRNPFAGGRKMPSDSDDNKTAERDQPSRPIKKIELPADRSALLVSPWSVKFDRPSERSTAWNIAGDSIEINTFGGRFEVHNDALSPAIDPERKVAVAAIYNPFEKQTLLTVVDLSAGTAGQSFSLGGERSIEKQAPFAISAKRNQLITLKPKQNSKNLPGYLEFRSLDSPDQVAFAWETATFFDRDGFSPEWARFTPDGKLLTVGTHLILWNVDNAEPEYVVKLGPGTIKENQIDVSPGHQLLAISNMRTIYLVDATSGKGVGQLDENTTAVRFSPDGTRLAGRTTSGEIKLWDLETGSLIDSFMDRGGIGGLAWTDDRFLLVDNQRLIDTTLRCCVWEYTRSHRDAVVSLGGGYFLLQQKNRMKVISLPHTDFAEQLDEFSLEELRLIKPGATFSLDLNLTFGEEKNREIQQTLEESLEQQGYAIAEESELVIRGRVSAEDEKTIEVRNMLHPFRGNTESITFTPHRSSIQIIENGKTIWNRSSYHGPSPVIMRRGEETLQEYADRVCKPSAKIFEAFKVPTDVFVLPGGKPFGKCNLWDVPKVSEF